VYDVISVDASVGFVVGFVVGFDVTGVAKFVMYDMISEDVCFVVVFDRDVVDFVVGKVKSDDIGAIGAKVSDMSSDDVTAVESNIIHEEVIFCLVAFGVILEAAIVDIMGTDIVVGFVISSQFVSEILIGLVFCDILLCSVVVVVVIVVVAKLLTNDDSLAIRSSWKGDNGDKIENEIECDIQPTRDVVDGDVDAVESCGEVVVVVVVRDGIGD